MIITLLKMFFFSFLFVDGDSSLLEMYRDRSLQLSIKKDLLIDKIDTYSQLVIYLQKKVKLLERSCNELKLVHSSCLTKAPFHYR